MQFSLEEGSAVTGDWTGGKCCCGGLGGRVTCVAGGWDGSACWGGGAGGAVAGKDWPNRLEFGHSEPGVYRICGVLDELNWTLVRSP